MRPRALVVGVLRAYKLGISPWLPPACRFQPTCSEYAMEAVERYGILRGTWLATRRLLRCHPLCRGGFDPVPDLEAGRTALRGPGGAGGS